jgi:hypothetical protein
MIPMFRVWEIGKERTTTAECLSDAQPIHKVNRQVRRYDLTSEKVVETLAPGWIEKLRVQLIDSG